jgi:polyisoprenoid-binding protein YceI
MKTSAILLALSALASIHGILLSQTRDLPSIEKESWVTYKLVHPLHEVEATSKEVTFLCGVDETAKQIRSVKASVDVTTFDSGNSNRDSHAMEVVNALSFPGATFASTSVAPRGDSLLVTGMLTFHGITRQIVARCLPHWTAQKLSVDGAFAISLTEFKVDRPTLLMIPVEDKLSFTFAAAFAL